MQRARPNLTKRTINRAAQLMSAFTMGIMDKMKREKAKMDEAPKLKMNRAGRRSFKWKTGPDTKAQQYYKRYSNLLTPYSAAENLKRPSMRFFRFRNKRIDIPGFGSKWSRTA